MRAIAEWDAPTPEQFRDEVVSSAEPAVLRGIAADWPLVRAARQSAQHCIALLAAHVSDDPVEVLRAEPEEEGRFHYTPDGRSLNFIRGKAPPRAFLAALIDRSEVERPHALVVQGLIARRHVPGFAQSHPMPLVPTGVEPRLWIGNEAKVATHNDPVDNVAVVGAGRRRFTLFPPQAEPDLYMGPADPTPAGTPVSMVHVTAPDFDRYPRFADAMAVAQEAELAPGDAIFIPRDWFHHVEALERLNLLVNYWWDAATNPGSSR